MLKEQIYQFYGHKIRVRVCGILIKKDKLLMLKHDGIGKSDFFWNTPGGEPENNENLKTALIREFKEETGLDVTIGKLLYSNQFIDSPLHAIEYYFETFAEQSNAVLGKDPENINVLSALKWFNKSEFESLHQDVKPQFLKTIF
jgi:ADP-ribose pyrophosphatase YjhB (NUDIX family)